MRTLSLHTLGICLVLLSGGACSTATNPIVSSEWRNPGYSKPSFHRVMIGGLGGATSVRRNFEDEFVSQLRASGIDAVPSYRDLPEDGEVDEAKIKQAAQAAGADATIFTRSIKVERKTQPGPSYYPAPWFGFYGSNVGVSWSGLYGAPSVSRYNEYTTEATLYDVAKNDVVWTATIRTTENDDIKTAIKAYVAAVIHALDEKDLLGRR
jgi:hypothetical protein